MGKKKASAEAWKKNLSEVNARRRALAIGKAALNKTFNDGECQTEVSEFFKTAYFY